MGLRELAEQDLGFILEGDEAGFRWPISITDPNGTTVSDLYGFSDDIAQIIDPDTGQAVSGRSASVAIRIFTLQDAGLGVPQGVADASQKPWLISFEDINGNSFDFKISQANPDRALGVVACLLELYVP